ncbi:aminotransferase class I/II-fold pyridoxal phosphate-dependent enzyme [Marinobacter sp. LV10R520-4]|uniref:aminotransferase class I/II-fold pyridoxal phosphate-dependent enzyme n=1 Tax=Marinobacter sp. LV10R520-4 TaxID=1761796 RepID=UPI001E5F191D|nr:PLP-dependent aminotransferase family protein [Marinobacter sp. LV10R520-4]
MTQPGDIVAVESPSFPGILQALEVVGLRALEIPTHTAEGLSLEGLELALEQWPVKACVVVCNHSNPMGARMSDERKQQLVSMLAVAHFLEQGGYDRYLRSARQNYRQATERMRTAVARSFPEGTAISRPQGGFVLWVQLPAGVSGTLVYQLARAENINVAPGLMFSISNKFESCLRINCGNPWSDRIDQAVVRLGALAHEVQARSI